MCCRLRSVCTVHALAKLGVPIRLGQWRRSPNGRRHRDRLDESVTYHHQCRVRDDSYSAAPRSTCSLGVPPLHHEPTGKELFGDAPEKLSGKIYENDSRKPARPDARPGIKVVGDLPVAWGVARSWVAGSGG